MEYVNCNLCGAEKQDFLYYVRDRNSLHATQFRLVRCHVCGLVFCNPRPSEEQIAEYYPRSYHTQWMTVAEPKCMLINGVPWREAMERRASIVFEYKKTGRILDFGCGNGLLLKYLSEKGWQTFGVETGDITFPRDKLGLSIRSSLDEFDFTEGSFDVVCLFHVLEHLHNPFALLRRIHNLLKIDGVLIIEVPNFGSFDARLFRMHWLGISAPLHLYQFTRGTLASMLKMSGYVPAFKYDLYDAATNAKWYSESIRFWLADWGLYPHALEKKKHCEKHQVDANVYRANRAFLHRLENSFFRLISVTMSRIGLGTASLAVAKKTCR